jgi:REP element-mobilizing transposase RayT
MAGGVYHVFGRGNRREPIFFDDEDRHDYLAIFGNVATVLGWHVLAYCLMTNHVHHVVELTEPNLSLGIRDAHRQYATDFNARHATGGGHLFQTRFGSTRAESDGAAMYFACYVLLNPVRAGMCATPEQYAWSSCAATLDPTGAPRWLRPDRLVRRFGSRDRFVQVLDAVRIMGSAGFEPPTSRI